MHKLSDHTEARIQTAVRDLEARTLAHLPGDIAKLVYLCSMRDYNTGRYYHDGLSLVFGADVAESALARCHERTFQTLVRRSLSQIVGSLQRYFQSTGQPRERIVQVWQKLQAYRVLIPAGCDSLSAELFQSNIKIALALLHHRERKQAADQQAGPALPQPLSPSPRSPLHRDN